MSITSKRPPEMDRLPKRLRDYVAALERQICSYEGLADGTRPTTVMVESSDRDTKRYLPEGTEVTFLLYTGGPGPHEKMRVRARDGKVEVRTELGRLVVYPEVSNVVGIAPERR